MSGKGSGRRPAAIADAQVAANWAAIFGAKPTGSPNKVETDNEYGEPDPEGAREAEGIAK